MTSYWKQKLSIRKDHKASTYQTQTSSQTDTKNTPNKAIKLVPEKAALSAVFTALLPLFLPGGKKSQSQRQQEEFFYIRKMGMTMDMEKNVN